MKKGKKIIAVTSTMLVAALASGITAGCLYAFGDKIIIGKIKIKL